MTPDIFLNLMSSGCFAADVDASKTMGCFDSTKFEAFPGTIGGTEIDMTKYPYVYGYKPQPPAPSKKNMTFIKTPETVTTGPTSDNICKPMPYKTCSRKYILPEVEYGVSSVFY
jgi:hypothetical protein